MDGGSYPAGFLSLDAARPWLLYWSLNSLCLLGEEMISYKDMYFGSIT